MKALSFLIVCTIALSVSFAFAQIDEETVMEDFTDSGVGCIEDCLDPAKEGA